MQIEILYLWMTRYQLLMPMWRRRSTGTYSLASWKIRLESWSHMPLISLNMWIELSLWRKDKSLLQDHSLSSNIMKSSNISSRFKMRPEQIINEMKILLKRLMRSQNCKNQKWWRNYLQKIKRSRSQIIWLKKDHK